MDARQQFRTFKHGSFLLANDVCNFMRPTRSSLLKQRDPARRHTNSATKMTGLSLKRPNETSRSLSLKQQFVSSGIIDDDTDENNKNSILSSRKKNISNENISNENINLSNTNASCCASSDFEVLHPEQIFESYYVELDDVLFVSRQQHQQNQQNKQQNKHQNEQNENQSSLLESAQEVVQLLNEQRTHRKLNYSLSKQTTTIENKSELSVRLIEVQCGLRKEIINEETFSDTKRAIEESLSYLSKLEFLSKKFKILKGTLFQECLGRGAHLPRKSICLSTYETGIVPLEQMFQNKDEENHFIRQTIDLCDLVRIKLADDNDLKSGTTILVDALGFFNQIHKIANRVQQSDWEVCNELVKNLTC